MNVFEPVALSLDECVRLATAMDVAVPAPPANPGALRAAAIYYASMGWPVFPLIPGGKQPLTSHGLYDASTDVDLVATWWDSWPLANIGCPTGVGFDVVDIDAPDGFPSFHDLVNESGIAPDVRAVTWTGSGGRHLFIPPTGLGNFAGLRPGLDYRGKGGYVVLPPSVLTNGGAYSWIMAPRLGLVAS